MPNTQQAPPVDSGLGKLIAVGMVILLPVLGLAGSCPPSKAPESGDGRSLESEGAATWSRPFQGGRGREAADARPRHAVAAGHRQAYDAEISLTPKLSIGTAMPESIYVADFKAKIEAQAPKEGQGKCQLELPCRPGSFSWKNRKSGRRRAERKRQLGREPLGLARVA